MPYPPTTGVDVELDPKDPYGVVDGKATRWVTREKRCLLISSMSSEHIVNTICFLERKRDRFREEEDAAWSVLSSFSQESMASYYCAQETSDISRRSAIFSHQVGIILAGLEAEARVRGIFVTRL